MRLWQVILVKYQAVKEKELQYLNKFVGVSSHGSFGSFWLFSWKRTPSLFYLIFLRRNLSLWEIVQGVNLTLAQGQSQVGLVTFLCLKQNFTQGFSNCVWRTVLQWWHRQSLQMTWALDWRLDSPWPSYTTAALFSLSAEWANFFLKTGMFTITWLSKEYQPNCNVLLL